MIGIPTAMVVVFFYLTITGMKTILPHHEPGSREPDVIITGHQWWWEVQYPGTSVTTANEIHLPAGKKILLEMQSADVVHSWWVPELGPKMDMLPGRKNYLWVTIQQPGLYEGACSEFCGIQHAWMRIRTIAHTQQEFDTWLQQQELPANPPTGILAVTGANIFQQATCANCHSIRGTSAQGAYGPDLTHFYSRKKMLAGKLDINTENIYRIISHPQQWKEGMYMPDFLLKKDTINALVQYLTQLK